MMDPLRCLALAVAALAAACAIERPAERAEAAAAPARPADAPRAATPPKTAAPGKAAEPAAKAPVTPQAKDAPKAASRKEAPKAAAPKAPPARPEAPKAEAPKAEPPKAEAPKAPAAAPLDLATLEKRLRATPAIGTFTKLAIKNQVDDLIERFRAFHAGRERVTLAELRQPYNMLIMKVLSLLQDGDPPLAGDIAASREALWSVLADKSKFTTLQGNA